MWTCKIDLACSAVPHIRVRSDAVASESNGRPRRGRKRKYPNQSRDDRKRLRNTNQPYVSARGKMMPAKDFEDFNCGCKQKCGEKVPVEVRKQKFITFWELGSHLTQNTYINACVKQTVPKRKYNHQSMKRSFSRQYTICNHIVCREFFIHTFGITTRRVNTALKKMRSPSLIDKRGHAGGHKKLPEDVRESVIEHINKFPRYKSHYCRKETESEFLDSSMNLRKMYDLYKADNTERLVSLSTYTNIFNTKFNRKFKKLKKDTCNFCDIHAIQLKNATLHTEKETITANHERHLKVAEEGQHKLKSDMEAATKFDHIKAFTFDLQKTLPLPRITTNVIFYKRQLWLYNCGIHSGKYNKGHCYIWMEGTAGRGSQEVGSCVRKYIVSHVPDGVKELRLWCDSCGGQNRNIKLTLMLKSVISTHPSLEVIIVSFPISGHSFLPNDADFGDIECALKGQQRLYTANDYISVMKTCRRKNPLIVVEMRKEDFLGTSKLEKMIVNRKIDIHGRKINWLHFRVIKLTKAKPYTIYAKESYRDDEPFSEIDVQPRTRGRPIATVNFDSALTTLWPEGKPISAPKLNDIKSIMDLIPADAKMFYENFLVNKNIVDDVEGFDGDLDFEPENE